MAKSKKKAAINTEENISYRKAIDEMEMRNNAGNSDRLGRIR
jgi:hypothetical protein